MSVVLLVLAGPLQAWGGPASHSRRDTGPRPTKSGVLGLVGAALGLARTDTTALADLARLRFGVRTDQPGRRERDFHTAPGANRTTSVTDRYYLADAVFLAALEADPATATRIGEALTSPVYSPALGRRSCVPSRPVLLEVRHDLHLDNALASTEWQASAWYQRRHRPTTLTVHTDAGAATTAQYDAPDHPIDFGRRIHTSRPVTVSKVPLPRPTAADPCPDLDFFSFLEGFQSPPEAP